MTKQEQWSRVCDLLFAMHKEDILRDEDWWYGTDHYDINIFDWGDDGSMEAVVYDITGKHSNYSSESVVYTKLIHTGVEA